MPAIAEVFLNSILPFFAISAVGYIFGRRGWFDAEMATTLNKFVVNVALPGLIFGFLATAPFDQYKWDLVTLYFASSIALYFASFLVMRFVFKLGPRESLLLGMAACFTNHVFFVYFIAQSIFGDAAAVPVVSIITFDAFLIFGGTFFIMDVVVSGAQSPLAAGRLLLKNPMILSLIVGRGVGVSGLHVPAGIMTYADFVGAAAAPASMFALGVILSGFALSKFDGPAFTVTGLKLTVHPLIVATLVFVVGGVAYPAGDIWQNTLIFTAAGPVGAMPFVIALQHGVNTERIVKAIVYSTLLSLMTLAVLGSL